MERSRDRDNQILEDFEGKPYGVFLAADYCGQHENGIVPLERMFAIDRSIPGIPGRTATRAVTQFTAINKTVRRETPESKKGRRRYVEHSIQMLSVSHIFNEEMLIQRDFTESTDIIGAFADDAFAIAAYSDPAKVALDEIRHGIQTGDLMIMMGGGSKNPFDRGGLVIARASKVPAEQAQVTLEADLEAIRLADAARATGIQEKLDARPDQRGPFPLRRYFALAPAWTSPGLIKGRSTSHPVIFFLNPAEQSKNNHGWFTVEELEQWLDGKGPIPKVPAEAAA